MYLWKKNKGKGSSVALSIKSPCGNFREGGSAAIKVFKITFSNSLGPEGQTV